jgi:hypothetical protein
MLPFITARLGVGWLMDLKVDGLFFVDSFCG